MRVSLVYNPGAGEGLSAEDLRAALAQEGFNVVHVLETQPDPERAMTDKADLVLVAGGDGTVARAAAAMKGLRLPLAILPLGTANNIANTLDLVRPLSDLMGRWRHPRILKMDVGMATVGGKTYNFVESTGGGLITGGIASMDNDPNPDCEDAEDRIERAIRTYRTLLANMVPRTVHIELDGNSMEKKLLMIEVLNIRSVGANVVVSLDATPSDGYFTVVMAGEAERGELDAYLKRRLQGLAGHLTLPTWRARSVRLEGWDHVHVDDAVVPVPAGEAVNLRIEPAVVNVLV